MKRTFIAAFLIFLCLLTDCSPQAARGAKTTQELAERYLAAIMNEKYEDVLPLLPEEIIEYGMKYLEGDREDVVDFVKYAASDYYWLAQLPTHVSYTFEMTEEHELPAGLKNKESVLFEEDGVRLYIQEFAGIELTIQAGQEEPFSGSLFALKIDGRWYLMSVAGDDELFVY